MPGQAYFIFAHRSPGQVVRLVRAVYHPDNVYLLHWDGKSSDEEYRRLHDELAFANMRYLEPRGKVYWGGNWPIYNFERRPMWQLLEIELRAMAELRKMGGDWTHLINLSGQCFPLVPERTVAAALSEETGRSFLELVDLPTWGEQAIEERFHYRIMRLGNHYIRVPGRRQLRVPAYGSSHFMILSREAVSYVCDSTAEYRSFFRGMLSPDETCIATALMNSPLAGKIEPHYKHYIDWSCPHPPKTLGMEDLDAILASGAWFCRKVGEGELLDRLEARLAVP